MKNKGLMMSRILLILLVFSLSACADLSSIAKGFDNITLFEEAPKQTRPMTPAAQEKLHLNRMGSLAGPTQIDFHDVSGASRSGLIQNPPHPGMFAGHRLVQLKGDLGNLRDNADMRAKEFDALKAFIESHLKNYYAILGFTKAKLQSGTTPNDQNLIRQWNDAKAHLDKVNEAINHLDALSKQMASASSVNSFLVESIRAAHASPAANKQDRYQLAQLEKEAVLLLSETNQELTELNNETVRNNASMNTEQGEMTKLHIAIQNGWLYRPSLTNRILAASKISRLDDKQIDGAKQRRPLIVIRFEEGKRTDYSRALQAALHETLRARPDARFDLITVSPNEGSPAEIMRQAEMAKNNAEEVLQNMTLMGMPLNRIAVSATRSELVTNNEVHIYLK